jgi:hypothetical protein
MGLADVLASPRWHRAVAWVRRSGMVLAGGLAGIYFLKLQAVAQAMDASMLVIGGAVGMGLPLLLRRRPPGELLVLVAFVLALLLSFAIPGSGG